MTPTATVSTTTTVMLDRAIVKKAKGAALEEDMTLRDWVERAIEEELKRRKR